MITSILKSLTTGNVDVVVELGIEYLPRASQPEPAP
jgi:hypothetical protein